MEDSQPLEEDSNKESTMSQKKQKLAEIYSKMARLEAFLNHTKSEIHRLDKPKEKVNSYEDTEN